MTVLATDLMMASAPESRAGSAAALSETSPRGVRTAFGTVAYVCAAVTVGLGAVAVLSGRR